METIKVSDVGGAESGSVGISLREAASRAARVLQKGGVVMHATETCYGFAADIFNRAALHRVYELKQMALDKPVSIMVRNLEEAQKYGDFGGTAVRLAEKFWPGPLTLVVPRKNGSTDFEGGSGEGGAGDGEASGEHGGGSGGRDGLPLFLNEGAATVGIRCPDFPLVHELLELFGGPLCTTSANVSGLPQAYSVEEYVAQMKGVILKQRQDGDEEDVSLENSLFLPDLILDSGALLVRSPSAVLEVLEGASPRFLREGDLAGEVRVFLDNV